MAMEEKNCKGLLIRYSETNKKPPPLFQVEPTGPPHDRKFFCKVYIDGILLGEAEEKTKRTAENTASNRALENLGYLQNGFKPEFVALLNEFCQRKNWTYNFIDGARTGPSHDPGFSCSVQIKESTLRKFPESSWKNTKKLAKKEAAYLALKELKKEFPSDIARLPDVFIDESGSESLGDPSLERSLGENGSTQTTTSTTSTFEQNYIAMLNEICQRRRWTRSFTDFNHGGLSHLPQFSCKATVNNITYAASNAQKTKKLAQKEAAFLALKELRNTLPNEIPELPDVFTDETRALTSSFSSTSNIDHNRILARNGASNAPSIEIVFESSNPGSQQRRSLENGLNSLSISDSMGTSVSSASNRSSAPDPLRDFDDISDLDAGAFGEVKKARKKLDDKYYAVKKIPVLRKHIARYLEEVKALASLEHINIVRYYHAWLAEDYVSISDSSESSLSSDLYRNIIENCLFIQMELCEKGSLKRWIKQRNAKKTVDKDESMNFFKQITEAVKYIHSKKLIHRDLKPANILFTKDMVVKLGDFGLVTQMTREDESRSRQRTKTGTPSYMAPEQKLGKYENEVDIYALGLILVELLWIFESRHEKQIEWDKIREGNLPTEFVRRYPVEECEIKKMLLRDPHKRPSAEELKRVFESNKILDSRTH